MSRSPAEERSNELGTTGTGSATIQCASTPCTLTNSNNTIEGMGTINSNASMTFLNSGTVDANLSGDTLTVSSGNVTNSGTFEADAGSTLLVSNSYKNFSGNTLTGGTLNVAGTIQINPLGTKGGEIVNNASTITLNGASSQLVDKAGKDALSALADNQAGARFIVENGRSFSGASTFANQGYLRVGTGSSFTASSGYDQSGVGAVTSIQGTFTSPLLTNSVGGTVRGIGTIVGDLMNYGTLQPGGRLGYTMSIDGNYTQASTGTLQILMAGDQTGLYGRLDVTDNVNLAGTLALDTILGFSISAGEKFDIIDPASISGDFSALTLDGLGCSAIGADNWRCSDGNGSLHLEEVFTGGNGVPEDLYLEVRNVPEPSSLALLGTGILATAGLFGRRRRRRLDLA